MSSDFLHNNSAYNWMIIEFLEIKWHLKSYKIRKLIGRRIIWKREFKRVYVVSLFLFNLIFPCSEWNSVFKINMIGRQRVDSVLAPVAFILWNTSAKRSIAISKITAIKESEGSHVQSNNILRKISS